MTKRSGQGGKKPRGRRAESPLRVTVTRSTEEIDLDAWIEQYVQAIIDVERDAKEQQNDRRKHAD